MTTIFWAGDSTIQENSILTYPQTGIGQLFHLFLKKDVHVENHAKNGRSTKSFIEELRLEAIHNKIVEGDFLFIQFGHNDEKKEDAARYTQANGEYMENLERFVNIARNKKAYPVLITPLERRCFDEDGNLGIGEHLEYVSAMKEIAIKLEVPVVDLYSKSRKELKKVGAEASKKWYMHLLAGEYSSYSDGLVDNTHLKPEGAIKFGTCIAEGLKELGGIYKELLIVEF
jgi:Lysophospholipase L1 and related esterases